MTLCAEENAKKRLLRRLFNTFCVLLGEIGVFASYIRAPIVLSFPTRLGEGARKGAGEGGKTQKRQNLFCLKKPRLDAAFADVYANRTHAPRTSADIRRSLFIFVDSGIHIATGEHYPDEIFSGFSHNFIFTRK